MSAGNGPATLELIEDAFGILRELPLTAWLWWASGVVPFTLLIVAFVTEMSGSANASDHLAGWALLLAVSYVWAGVAQTIFANLVRARFARHSAAYRFSDLLRSAALVQASRAVILPFGVASILGAPSAIAFYQNAAAYPYQKTPSSLREVIRYAAREAARWPAASLLCQMVLLLLSVAVFANVFVLLIAGPILFRTLTGVESELTRHPMGILNLTTLCAAVAITWACLDPIAKAVYAGRCFRADSLRTGADLRAALNDIRSPIPEAAVMAAAFLLSATRVTAGTGAVDPQRLKQAIEEVVNRPEYVWRSPTLARPEFDNPIAQFISDAIKPMLTWIADAVRWLAEVIERLMRSISASVPVGPSGGPAASGPLIVALVTCMVLLGGGIAYLVFRRRLSRKAPTAITRPVAQIVDLTSEEVRPDQLPGPEWLSLADDYFEKGDLRMACRAVFLGLLAALGSQGYISIHRAKSNLDYFRELVRRTRGNSGLHDLVRASISVFERCWYGDHPLSRQEFETYRSVALEASNHAE